MWRMLLYTTCSLFSVVLGMLASPRIKIEDFTHVTRLQDRLDTHHGIAVVTIPSLTGCSALCLSKGNCWSFFYDFVNYVCRLNKSPFLDLSETTSQSGYHHFSREFCDSSLPSVAHTTQTITFTNEAPTITYACTTGAIYISGNNVMTCNLGSLQWNVSTIDCRDLSPYTARGYSEVCGTESVLKFVGNKVPFDTGKTTCTGDGSHLARPRTTVRWDCLKEYVFSQTSGVHVWMDITDRNVEGVLVFSDNTAVPPPYPWLPGEPFPASKDSADCIAIWPSHQQWDDMPCGNLAFFVCEIEL
ncbi:uncharacterized protein [Argopecten irradians]|uniref:uncharacterized protein n=1 Tax=Argopecten irradians TaxID=31199 RepID=UPI003715EDD8